eukprot:6294470-Amphidinium_carterae.1
MESSISAHFVPNASKCRIERTAKAILSAIGTALQVPVALSAKAGFQASKVRTTSGDLRQQVFSRVPLDFVVRFTP